MGMLSLYNPFMAVILVCFVQQNCISTEKKALERISVPQDPYHRAYLVNSSIPPLGLKSYLLSNERKQTNPRPDYFFKTNAQTNPIYLQDVTEPSHKTNCNLNSFSESISLDLNDFQFSEDSRRNVDKSCYTAIVEPETSVFFPGNSEFHCSDSSMVTDAISKKDAPQRTCNYATDHAAISTGHRPISQPAAGRCGTTQTLLPISHEEFPISQVLNSNIPSPSYIVGSFLPNQSEILRFAPGCGDFTARINRAFPHESRRRRSRHCSRYSRSRSKQSIYRFLRAKLQRNSRRPSVFRGPRIQDRNSDGVFSKLPPLELGDSHSNSQESLIERLTSLFTVGIKSLFNQAYGSSTTDVNHKNVFGQFLGSVENCLPFSSNVTTTSQSNNQSPNDPSKGSKDRHIKKYRRILGQLPKDPSKDQGKPSESISRDNEDPSDKSRASKACERPTSRANTKRKRKSKPSTSSSSTVDLPYEDMPQHLSMKCPYWVLIIAAISFLVIIGFCLAWKYGMQRLRSRKVVVWHDTDI